MSNKLSGCGRKTRLCDNLDIYHLIGGRRFASTSPRLDLISSPLSHRPISSRTASFQLTSPQPLSSHPNSTHPLSSICPSQQPLTTSCPLPTCYHAPYSATQTNVATIASINCLYTNATSLNSVKKRADLELRSANGFEIIFVTEKWFNDTSIVSLSSYKAFRRDRGSHGGGVII